MYCVCSAVLLRVFDTCIKSRLCVKEINVIVEHSEEHTAGQGLCFRTPSPNNEYQWFNIHHSLRIYSARCIFLVKSEKLLDGFNEYGKRL